MSRSNCTEADPEERSARGPPESRLCTEGLRTGHKCIARHILEEHTCRLCCHHHYAGQYSPTRSAGYGKLKMDPGQEVRVLEILHKLLVNHLLRA